MREPDSHASAEARDFHRGLALFNEGDFFTAHEVWEEVWHHASGERKRLYQGLIQLAVAFEHARRGNPRGVRSVYTSAREKLRTLPSPFRGIDLARLLREADAALKAILNLPPERFAPGLPHGQELPFDPARCPRIDLLEDPFGERADG